MPSILGTPQDDYLDGTDVADEIYGFDGDDYIRALAGNDVVDGGLGNDTVFGQDGDDTLTGGDGNDHLAGGDGTDVIHGGNGNDTIEGEGGGTNILANAGGDTIYGDAGQDTIDGGRGNDTIYGGDDFDQLYGGPGSDYIDGGNGDDVIAGGDTNQYEDQAPDTLIGGEGNDRFEVYYGDTVDGGPGRDGMTLFLINSPQGIVADFRVLTGGGSITIGGATLNGIEYFSYLVLTPFNDVVILGEVEGYNGGIQISGGDGDDDITGSSKNDTIDGGAGNDIIRGGVGINPAITPSQDQLYGGTGNDRIYIGSDGASASGGPDDDIIIGGSAVDQINGDSGNDYIDGGAGNDVLNGGEGIDTLSYLSAAAGVRVILGASFQVTGGGGNDQTIGFENLVGSSFNDLLYGDNATNEISGGLGDDLINGGGGIDTASYADATSAVIVTLALTTAQNTIGAGVDTLLMIENLVGSNYADSLTGDNSANGLFGNAGDDTLTGGTAADTLTGGAGNDTFLDTRLGLSGDTITDFATGDKIVISDATLAGFAFSLAGSTLTYTGGSLTLTGGVSGQLVASAATGGGVQLTIAPTPDVANDFNGDGRSDILWRNVTNGQLSDWLGQANGGFVGNDANAFATVPTSWTIVGTGDFNGDGRDDVLWRNSNGQLSDWLATANGGFTPNDANALTSVPISWSVVGTGDFNGDGRDDILWRNSNGQLSDWLGQANGGFVGNDANAFTTVPTNWHVAGTGDFNGDGRDDILWRNDAGQLSDWLGQANGGFTPNDANAFASAPTNWHIVGTGDFNGDGRDDILWRSDAGQLSDWLGQANGAFVGNDANAFTTVPTSWSVVAVGDYNGDGRDDILWRNTNGQLSDWLGNANGGFTPNDANASTNVPTNWHVQAESLIL